MLVTNYGTTCNFYILIWGSIENFVLKVLQKHVTLLPLNVVDNDGPRIDVYLNHIGISNYSDIHRGDIIVVVIKETIPNIPLETSGVIENVIVRTYKDVKRT